MIPQRVTVPDFPSGFLPNAYAADCELAFVGSYQASFPADAEIEAMTLNQEYSGGHYETN
jgi:hypothetical protein